MLARDVIEIDILDRYCTRPYPMPIDIDILPCFPSEFFI